LCLEINAQPKTDDYLTTSDLTLYLEKKEENLQVFLYLENLNNL